MTTSGCCVRFNAGKCRANTCRHAHVCAQCGGSHSAKECLHSAVAVYTPAQLLQIRCAVIPDCPPLYTTVTTGVCPPVKNEDGDVCSLPVDKVKAIVAAHGGSMRVAELCAEFIQMYEVSLSSVGDNDMKPADRLQEMGFVLIGRGVVALPDFPCGQPAEKPRGLRPGSVLARRPDGNRVAKGRNTVSRTKAVGDEAWLRLRCAGSDLDTSAGEASSSDGEGSTPLLGLKPVNSKPNVAVQNMFSGLEDSDTKSTCCRRWNMGSCKAIKCKFGHFCSDCDSPDADHHAGSLHCPVAQAAAVRAGAIRLPPGLAL
eukprot:CAMPEP_0204252060 /NCGR_PEP_ID=MMETSP0468-20130131/842_1 /ASSEMBLY_ACC=CAM_ASM_000383 /TAXON_ID=2969 /ORGANISM="Oxyrrhis marina" /LENGTH=313 /DNA_ID=CAMNT_0051225447 /DNA_START=144 /DNA_END=1085 /DNA_ORIENTATION=-